MQEEKEDVLGRTLRYWGAATTFALAESKPEFTKEDYASRVNTYVSTYRHRLQTLRRLLEEDEKRAANLRRLRDEANSEVLKDIFSESLGYHERALRAQYKRLTDYEQRAKFFAVLKELVETEGWNA